MNVAANIAGTRYISLRAVISCFWFTYSRWRLEPWRCGSGRRALTGGGGRAEPAVFGGWGARRFLVDVWGLAEASRPIRACPKRPPGRPASHPLFLLYCMWGGDALSRRGAKCHTPGRSVCCVVLPMTQSLPCLITFIWFRCVLSIPLVKLSI